jgi:HEPN domain-containing protein
MLDRKVIRSIAKGRLKDAEVLLKGKRYEGAIYLCGYAVELALKARICQTLKWTGFPATPAEFSDYKSFKTHDLDVLLHLSGLEAKIKTSTSLLAGWSAVAQWSPESRYSPLGKATQADAESMVTSAKTLLGKL